MAVFAGKNAKILICSDTATPFTGQVTTADTSGLIYTISNSARRFLDPATPVTVKRNGTTTVAAGQCRVVYAGGKAIFLSDPTGAITIDGSYLTTSTLGEAKEWSIDIEQELLEKTAFGDDWKSFVPSLKGASGSLSKWWVDEFFHTKLTAGTLIGLSLEATTNKTYDIFARLTTDSVQTAIDGLVEESLDFQVVSDLSTFGM